MSHCQITIRQPFGCCGKFLLLSVVMLTASTVRSSSSLRDRWALPDIPTAFEFEDDETVGGLDFVFEFPVSRDVATLDNIDVTLYDRGCKYNDGEPNVELFKGTSEEIIFPATASSSNAATVMTNLEVTLGNDEMNVASLIKEYPSLWNEEKSQITFCVRFSLMTEDIEVNFLETVVILDVVLVGIGFRIEDAVVRPKEKIESISRVSYDVKAYLCDGQYRPLSEDNTGIIDKVYEICNDETGEWETVTETVTTTTTTENGQVYEQELSDSQKVEQEKITYFQGSVVRICIRPDDTVLGQVSMRTIEQMVFEGTVVPSMEQHIVAVPPTTYMSDGLFTQVAVENGSTAASSGLSAMSCEPNRMEGREDVVVCAVDTLLVAAFYWRTPGLSASVRAYGVAQLKFGGATSPNRERHLQQVSHRNQRAVALDTYWNMTRPIVEYSGIDEPGGGFDFDMKYTLSDGIASDMMQLEVWKKSCQQVGMDPELEYTTSKQSSSDLLEMTTTGAYETGDGSGTQTVTVSGRWKREDSNFAPMLRDSEYYAENSDGSLVQISLCVRYQLHTKPFSGAIEVNFLETPVIVNIDMKAGIDFGVGFSLVSDEDECLKELVSELQQMSAGRTQGLDDLSATGLFWSPGGKSADPTMPMGPPISPFSQNGLGSSNNGGYAGTYRMRSSARASKHSWRIAMVIGIIVFSLSSWT